MTVEDEFLRTTSLECQIGQCTRPLGLWRIEEAPGGVPSLVGSEIWQERSVPFGYHRSIGHIT